MRTLPTSVLLALLLGCGDKDPADSAAITPGRTDAGTTSTTGTPPGTTSTTTTGTTTVTTDVDGDGYSVAAGDCDDADPTVSPGTLETLDDGVDRDCDTVPDVTPWATSGTWVAPRPPVVVANNLDTLVFAGGDLLTQPMQQTENPVFAIPLPLAGAPNAAPASPAFKLHGQTGPGPALPISDRIDGAPRLDGFSVGMGYSFELNTGYNAVHDAAFDPLLGAYVADDLKFQNMDTAFQASAVDTALGSLGHRWSVACSSDRLIALHSDPAVVDPDAVALGPSPLDPDGFPGGICFWDGVPDDGAVSGTLVSCAPDAPCETHTAAGTPFDLTPSAVAPWSGETLRDARAYEDRVLVLDDQPGLRLYDGAFTRVLSDWTVTHADWSTRPGPAGTEHAVFFVGQPAIDDGLGPRLVLAWGPMDALSTVTLDPAVAGIAGPIVPTGVGVHLDANRVALAFSGEGPVDDTVAWAFYDL